MSRPPRSVGRPLQAQSKAYRAQVHDVVVRTASRLFRERGVAAVAIRDIVSESGVSVGSLYHHFRGKDAIVDAVVERIAGEIGAEFDRAVGADNSEAEGRARRDRRRTTRTLETALRQAINAGFARRDLARLVLGPDADPRLRRRIFDHFAARTENYFRAHPELWRTPEGDPGEAEMRIVLAARAWQGALFAVLDWTFSVAPSRAPAPDAVSEAMVRWNMAALGSL